MKLKDFADYDFQASSNSMMSIMSIVQSTNSNNSVNTFFNLNEGIVIDGIDSLENDLIKTYVCKNNDDLRLVSFTYYGTIELWWLLAKINGIDDSLEPLEAGRKLKILPKEYMQYIISLIKDEKAKNK